MKAKRLSVEQEVCENPDRQCYYHQILLVLGREKVKQDQQSSDAPNQKYAENPEPWINYQKFLNRCGKGADKQMTQESQIEKAWNAVKDDANAGDVRNLITVMRQCFLIERSRYSEQVDVLKALG